MRAGILRLLCIVALATAPCASQARTLTAKIARIATGVATLQQVEVRLDWPAAASEGVLHVRAGRVDAPDLGYRFRDLDWRCPLARDGHGGWRCDGALRSGRGTPLRLSVDLATATTDVRLTRGASRLELHRQAATPDDTVLDLARVPLAWTQALLAQAWPEGRLKAGTLDGQLVVSVPARRPLRVAGTLALAGGALDTPDATIAAEHLGARLAIDYRKTGATTLVGIDGTLRGGELLFGNAYVALPASPVALRIDAMQRGAAGWEFPRIEWRDGDALAAQGSAVLAPDASLRGLDLALRSGDLSPVGARYLSGFLGAAGLGELALGGALDARIRVDGGRLQALEARLAQASLHDGDARFRFDGLDGDLRFSAGAPADSALQWRGGSLYGIDFGAARLPLRSEDGAIELREPASVPALGGQLRFDRMTLRPPAGDDGLDLRFGLTLDAMDVAVLAKAMGWPEFRGTLSGRIPDARYADERLVFDGGLAMRVFDGDVRVSSLAMERPFGVAPTLSADIELDDLDLLAVTEVFDFGSISGRLDGRIDALRLVDWQATAFDAHLQTQRKPGVRQRISQRAVQSISSVGGGGGGGGLQAQLIGLFDDFGYARIGISCRLAVDVCEMGGLRSAGNTFTIVEGAGIPRLTVIGHNRRVDWPTLVERLAAVGKGDVKPVVE